MKFFKKNQVVVAVIGLMFIAAGYLNFTNHENNQEGAIQAGKLADSEQMASIGDATLVSTTPSKENILENAQIVDENVSNNLEEDAEFNYEENIEKVQTNATITTDEYFTKSRLERETMYSQMIESYQKILDKTTISEKQRTTAQNEITKINQEKNAIMIVENLIKTKGFEDLIIFINDGSVNIIVKAKQLEAEQIAQIQNIVTRELKVDISNIHISNKE